MNDLSRLELELHSDSKKKLKNTDSKDLRLSIIKQVISSIYKQTWEKKNYTNERNILK
jgi:hypothetical protein